MRLFIAVNFDNTVKKYIGGIENKIKGFVKSGNFVDEENIHLTVRFIGEADSDELESLCIAMNEACSSFKGFKMALNGIGFFPRGNKSIVWAGIEECRPLGILYSRLEKSLQRQGFGRNRQERRF